MATRREIYSVREHLVRGVVEELVRTVLGEYGLGHETLGGFGRENSFSLRRSPFSPAVEAKYKKGATFGGKVFVLSSGFCYRHPRLGEDRSVSRGGLA